MSNVKETINEEANTVEVGKNSRMKKVLIEEAIKAVKKENPDKALNRFDICAKLAEIMVSKYKDGNLDYHSKRMGMATTSKMLKEIDNYIYKNTQY